MNSIESIKKIAQINGSCLRKHVAVHCTCTANIYAKGSFASSPSADSVHYQDGGQIRKFPNNGNLQHAPSGKLSHSPSGRLSPSPSLSRVPSANSLAKMNSFQRLQHSNTFKQYARQMSAQYPTHDDAKNALPANEAGAPKSPKKSVGQKVFGRFTRNRQSQPGAKFARKGRKM